MAKNTEHIQHVKSNVVESGKPKLPQPNVLVEGELAINYAEGVETISLKNSSGNVVTFSSDNYYTEQKLGSGFTGENSGVTVTEALENIEIDVDQVIDSGTSASTNAVSTKAVYDALTDNEFVWANAYVTMSGAVSSHTTNTNIHITNADREKLDSITDTLGSMAYENTSSYSSATEVNTALSGKVNTSDVDQVLDSTVSSSTNPVSTKAVFDVIRDNEYVISTAINDLNGRIDGIGGNEVDISSGITPSGDTIVLWVDESENPSEIEIDQAIDSGTSASTNAVSTSAVYGFVTSYTPSITVDQVLDDTTSASTNPIATKAVYDYITDNEYVISTAINDLNEDINDLSGQTETVAAALVEIHSDLSEKISQSDVAQVLNSTVSANTNPIAASAVYQVVRDNERILSSALIDLDYKITLAGNPKIIAASGTTLSAETGNYYRFDDAVEILTITLPEPDDIEYTNGIIFSFTTDTGADVEFVSTAPIKYRSGYSIDDTTTYEINAIYNGSYWSLAEIKLEDL